MSTPLSSFFFFFNDTATTEIYTLSLHDALPICVSTRPDKRLGQHFLSDANILGKIVDALEDRKSTRLNSSHSQISYAVFCLKKKKKKKSNVNLQHNICTHAVQLHRSSRQIRWNS